MKSGKMEIATCVVGPVRTSCYLLANGESKKVIIVDPGSSPEIIKAKIEKEGLTPVAIILTHGHFDHILAVKDIASAYSISVYANEDEREVLLNDHLNLSLDFNGSSFSCDANQYLRDGEKITLAGFEIEAIATPGHTQGGMCYYFPNEQIGRAHV